MNKSLPAPRLQLRWAEHKGDHPYEWECHYEIVIPLREHDIRRERWVDGERQEGEDTELVVALKPPTMRGSSEAPCEAQDGTEYCDSPYRDGAHAQWDSEVLGNLPIYVISPTGKAFLMEKRA